MSNQEISKRFDKLDDFFLKESQKQLPSESRLQPQPVPAPAMSLIIPQHSNLPLGTNSGQGFNKLKQDKNRGKKHETQSKWDKFQPYAYKKLSDRERQLQFLQLFDDYQSSKKALHDEKERYRKLEAQFTKARKGKNMSPHKGDNFVARDHGQARELKEQVKRLQEKIIALTGNKNPFKQQRPQSSKKPPQKTIFPSNQNMKAELQLERKQVRELLFVVQQLKNTKFSLETQLKEKQQQQPYQRQPKTRAAVPGSESQFQDQLFEMQRWKEKYQDMEDCYNKMSHQKDKKIRELEVELIELKENSRNKVTAGFSRMDNVNNELLETKIEELQRSKEKLEQQLMRLASSPFNQSNSGKAQADLLKRNTELEVAIGNMKSELSKVREERSKCLAQIEYSQKENMVLKTNNDKLKKQVKDFIERQHQSKVTMEVDYNDYYRKLLGVVKLEGDDPIWRKYAGLSTPDFRTMPEEELKETAKSLWMSKLELLAHLEKAQVELRTVRESTESRVGLYLKDKASLEEELRVARARLEQWSSMERLGARRDIKIYDWAGIQYDDSISVFEAEEVELKELRPTQNYFDLFLGNLTLEEVSLLKHPNNKIKQAAQLVSFLTVDFYNHETQHSHFVEGTPRNVASNFSFRVEMDLSLARFMSRQAVRLELWSPQGNATVQLGRGEIWLRDLIANATKEVSSVVIGKCPIYQPDSTLIGTLQYRIRMRLPLGSLGEISLEDGKESKIIKGDPLRLGQRKKLQIRVLRGTGFQPSSSTFVYFNFQGEDFFTEATKGSNPEWSYARDMDVLMGQQLEEEWKQNYFQFTVFDDERPVNEDVLGLAKADLTGMIDAVRPLDFDLDVRDPQTRKVGQITVRFAWV